MNYSKLSDDAINMEVTEKFFGCEKWDYNEKDRCFFHCGIDGSGYYSQSIVDFCSNPANAWPIMLASGIATLAEDGELVGAATDSHEAYESYGNIVHTVYDKNPLRAAMIVFLMMQENEND